MRLSLPYEHLNLRHNPFGEVDPCRRAGLAIVDVDEIVSQLRSPRFAVQFLGDRGRGKTTHLLAIRASFGKGPYMHIAEGQRIRELPRAPAGVPIFIDELQRLPRSLRGELPAGENPLVLGTHRDFRRALRRAGYEVRTVRPAELLTATRVKNIFERRIEYARRSPGAVPAVSVETIADLLGRYGSNVRGMEHEMYERFQELQGVCDV
ncbi:MAG: hypothetical protein QGH60_11605 [Phycisphaerae bacterium]|nr:hypothetical protein [Phycisphaerae bacterium]